ncbi:MAG: DNA repair protein RecO [Legionella sp.]
MKIDEFPAWLIYKYWSGDTSTYAVFFTVEQGLVKGLCRGGRLPKKQSLLQPFQPLWITLKSYRDWNYIAQLESMSPSLYLSGDCLFAGLYMNELIYYTLPPNESFTKLYHYYSASLDALLTARDQQSIEIILRRFEMALLKMIGYDIIFTYDCHGKSIDPKLNYVFIPDEGFIVNDHGIVGTHIIAIANDQLINLDILRSVKYIMRRAINFVTEGKPFKSRQLYKKSIL